MAGLTQNKRLIYSSCQSPEIDFRRLMLASTLTTPFSLVAPFTVPTISKVATWSKMTANAASFTFHFIQQEGKRGEEIKAILIRDTS